MDEIPRTAHPGGPIEAAATTLFLAGDVMTGRGVDQILPRSVDPTLHEAYVRDARRYVGLARESGAEVPDEADYDYVWGDALDELERAAPDHRIVNLETAVTTHDEPWPGKGIHYRMHPGNLPVLEAAGIDACVLANNHVLDWGRPGLDETLRTLAGAGIAAPGAGRDREAARAPAVLERPGGGPRVLVFACGSPTSGIPPAWEATAERSGVAFLPDLGGVGAERVADRIRAHREPGDHVVVSVHWGPNWGYDVPQAERAFAHRLIDEGVADVVHGHSSHHPEGLEIHGDRLVLYGAGDFLNDYEGIGGYETYRGELTLMYLPRLAPSGALLELVMIPLRIAGFRLNRAGPEEARWLRDRLDRESRAFETRVELRDDGCLTARRQATPERAVTSEPREGGQ